MNSEFHEKKSQIVTCVSICNFEEKIWSLLSGKKNEYEMKVTITKHNENKKCTLSVATLLSEKKSEL